MVNNVENERESSPPKAVKKRSNRLPPVLNTPVVADTSYMTPGPVSGGYDFNAALNVVQGSGAMNYKKAQMGYSNDDEDYDEDDVDDDDYVADDYANSNAAKFARGRKVAPATTANVPEGYRYGQSIYPPGTSVQARKKLAGIKNSGLQSSEAGPSSTIAAAGTNSAGNAASPGTTSSSITATGTEFAGNASPDTNPDTIIAAGSKSSATKSSATKSSATKLSETKLSDTKLSDTTSKDPKSVGNKSATSKSTVTNSSNLKPPVRYSQSCTPCRRRKVRCVKVEGQDNCEFCEEKNKFCFYEPTSKKITKLRPGEDDSLPPSNTKNVRFAADTKNTSEDVDITGNNTTPATSHAKPKRKSGKAQKKMTSNVEMTGDTTTTTTGGPAYPTAATAATTTTTPTSTPTYIIGDDSSSDLEMTGQAPIVQEAAAAQEALFAAQQPLVAAQEPLAAAQEPLAAAQEPLAAAQEPLTAAQEPLAGAGAQEFALPGMGFFDNSGSFTKYEEAVDRDDAGFLNYNPADEADQDAYLDLNSAGALLDQFEYERTAWPDVQEDEEDYSHFLTPAAPQVPAPAPASQPEPEPETEAAGAAAAQAGPHHAQLAFREAPSAAAVAAAAVPFPDLTADIPHELPAEFPLPGSPAYVYSCAKVHYMCEKALADNLRAAMQGGGGRDPKAAEELAEQERKVEALRLEAIEMWEAANAAEPAGKVHDPVGIQFLRAFAPQ
ncbi:hypothetical protein VMCG_09005 [Cytospora schulzeri]|uniref:Zn(2)-C6 fungal-type domain-containing protein n=1 Tax=Cytospora schulzeri TaxID=448051 RepID=A0A423VPN5_9PEZI|nr:hypothetical protein VMCG_09005 [Valsa malicola]